MLTKEQKIRKIALLKEKLRRKSKSDFYSFCRYTDTSLKWSEFHKTYYKILDMFAQGKIKRLMVTVPPQHGKSEGSTRKLPTYLIGANPNLNIAVGSYNDTFAKKFIRQIKRNINTEEFGKVFDVRVPTMKDSEINTANEFEIPNYKGSIKGVGRGGGLTGNTVDIMVMDDLYKDSAEGNSPVIRESVWEWYTTVVRTRLHNDSQELIVFTRWHEDDLIGRLEKSESVITVEKWADLENIQDDVWVKINFEAIKESEATEIDNRDKNEPLWGDRHSFKKLNSDRLLDPAKFASLHQGDPTPKEGLMWDVDKFKTYTELPHNDYVYNYTDTADTGKDFLCSINYIEHENKAYATDICFTTEPMEITEPMVAKMLDSGGVRLAFIESNNGGRGFARKIDDLTAASVSIEWFHQGSNKESRITTNAASVQNNIVFPIDWPTRWPVFYNAVKMYKKEFKANKHDDGPDVLTGIIEKMVSDGLLAPESFDFSISGF